MIYVGGMPSLSPEQRLEHLPELDLGAVRITPAAAVKRADDDSPATITLRTVLGRPAYSIDGETVFADDGASLRHSGRETAREVAAKFSGAPLSSVRFVRTVERPDQWTVLLGRELPLEKFAVDDGRGTEVYNVPYNRHGRARDDRAYARLRVDCDDSPLVLLHEPAHESSRLGRGQWYGSAEARLRTRGARPRARRRAVPEVEAVQLRKVDSLPGLDAVALHPRRVLRRVRATWVFSGLLSMEPFEWTNATGLRIRPAPSRAVLSTSRNSGRSTRLPGARCAAAAR
jgi:hypothetical protein